MSAGFFLRFFAMFLDILILLAVDFALILIISFFDYNMQSWFHITKEVKLNIIEAVKYPIAGIFILIPWLYFSYYESSPKRATYGKFLFDMHVGDMQGKKISFARASARFWLKFLSALPVFAGFFLALFTPKKQALHDLISGTLVISGKAQREHDVEPPSAA